MEKLHNAATFLWRYILIKARHREMDARLQNLSIHDFEYHLNRRRRVFDEIVVDPDQSPPLTADAKDDDFFQAVVLGQGSLPGIDANTLAASREYVLHGCDVPLFEANPETAEPRLSFEDRNRSKKGVVQNSGKLT